VREILQTSDSGGRVTLQRLGSFVTNRLISKSGDLMAATLITGEFSSLSRTERFYAAYDVAKLRHLYYSAASNIYQQIFGEQAPTEIAMYGQEKRGFVGARLCAEDKAVRESIRQLGFEIEASRGHHATRIRYHNLLTLHTVLLFGFCTSCRPIRTPYIWLDRVDEETGFAYLADKDDDAHHKLRLIWVPDLCRQQMKSYQQHLAKLASSHAAIRDYPDPCFFLRTPTQSDQYRERVIEEVRAKTRTQHMNPFLDLPANFHRKYMRHRLIVPVRVRPFFPQGLEDDSLNACMNIQSLQFVALAAAVRRWCRLPDLTRRVV
jgi:hypothetical protein